MILIELLVVIGAILIGARLGGMGLGLMGGAGLVILTFVFGLQPTTPPIDVILIIAAVISAASVMQSAGGLNFMVNMAAKILKKNPNQITFVAPIVSYLFTFVAGTGHIAYAILPVIAEVARKTGVRPERPMSISVIASQQAITSSPVSAATAVMLVMLAPYDISLFDILIVSIPATLIGVIAGAFSVMKYGKELRDDQFYNELLAKGEFNDLDDNNEEVESSPMAKRSVLIFILGVIAIVILGSFPDMMPSWSAEDGSVTKLGMPVVIQIVMLTVAAIMMLGCRVKGDQIAHSSVFSAGMQAVIAIFGIAWMGDTFIQAHMVEIKATLLDFVTNHSWTFAIALFVMSVLLYSQAATLRALLPLGIALGLPASTLIAMFPAVNGYFFIPNYPTIVAGISFDRTGTTRIGKYLLNHSFMLPGMVASIVSIIVGYILVGL